LKGKKRLRNLELGVRGEEKKLTINNLLLNQTFNDVLRKGSKKRFDH